MHIFCMFGDVVDGAGVQKKIFLQPACETENVMMKIFFTGKNMHNCSILYFHCAYRHLSCHKTQTSNFSQVINCCGGGGENGGGGEEEIWEYTN